MKENRIEPEVVVESPRWVNEGGHDKFRADSYNFYTRTGTAYVTSFHPGSDRAWISVDLHVDERAVVADEFWVDENKGVIAIDVGDHTLWVDMDQAFGIVDALAKLDIIGTVEEVES